MLKPEDIKKERKRFTEDNLSADNDSGMIIYDNKFSDLKQVESKPYTPNALQMQHIQENVCTHFGTNMDILQNKFDENTWNAYYEGKIEPFAIQLSFSNDKHELYGKRAGVWKCYFLFCKPFAIRQQCYKVERKYAAYLTGHY